MQITIFDDKLSLLHFLLGVASPLLPPLMLVFLVYEFSEYFSNCETIESFLGDLLEFILGYTLTLTYLYYI